jgi:HEAT repeat protein
VTDRDDLDLTPQQRSALRRADENPEQLTEHDGRILGELLANGDDDSRKEAASSIKHASARSEAARSLAPEVGRLTAALDDEVPLVLSWTAGALGNIGAEAPEQVSEAVDPLITLLHYRPGYLRVRSAAATALGKIGAEAPGQVTEAIGPLVSLLDDEHSSIRGVAAAALGDIGGEAPGQVGEAIEPLAAARDDEDGFVRSRATDALRNIGRGAPEQGSEAADPPAAPDDERAARRNACRALLRLEPDAIDDEEAGVRRRAAWALGHD